MCTLALMLAACPFPNKKKDNTPASLTPASLAGSWFGTFEDNIGIMHSLSVTINSSGAITQILVDAVNNGITGTITKSPSGTSLFSFSFSSGQVGGFHVDSGVAHAAFLVDDFSIGVLQKGASSLPTYLANDIAGAWSGYSVTLNSDFSVNQTFNSNATVDNNMSRTFVGSDIYGTFSGSFPTTSINTTTYGRWIGTYYNASTSGPVRVFLSPDKIFAATWACNTPISFPTGCSFSAWQK